MRIEFALQSLHTISSQRHAEIIEHVDTMSTQRHHEILHRLDQTDRSVNEKIFGYILATTTTAQPPASNLKIEPHSTEELSPGVYGGDENDAIPGVGKQGTLYNSAEYSTTSTVRFTLVRASRCEGRCDCCCHSRKWIRTPMLLKSLLGILFVGYSGLPVPRNKCDKPNCHSPTGSSLKITYCFPLWFMSRAIYILLAQSRSGEPSFGITIRRRIEYSSEESIMKMAQSGNLEGIKILLQSRKASPNDVTRQSGQTALHVSEIKP
jgi:hypothetical protein